MSEIQIWKSKRLRVDYQALLESKQPPNQTERFHA